MYSARRHGNPMPDDSLRSRAAHWSSLKLIQRDVTALYVLVTLYGAHTSSQTFIRRDVTALYVLVTPYGRAELTRALKLYFSVVLDHSSGNSSGWLDHSSGNSSGWLNHFLGNSSG